MNRIPVAELPDYVARSLCDCNSWCSVNPCTLDWQSWTDSQAVLLTAATENSTSKTVTSHQDVSQALLQTADGVIVRVYVQPKARREQFIGMHSDRLKLAVKEPPDKGKANAAVIRLLSLAVQLPPSQTELLRGLTSRQKDVLLRGRQVAEIAAALSACLEQNG